LLRRLRLLVLGGGGRFLDKEHMGVQGLFNRRLSRSGRHVVSFSVGGGCR
jgi:hypothetical protein